MRDAVEAVRRARRSERVVEEISRCVARDDRNRQLGAFDPNVGASGRPEPFFEFPARPPASRREVVWLNHEHGWGEKFEWTGALLTIEEARYNSRKFTIYFAFTSREESLVGSVPDMLADTRDRKLLQALTDVHEQRSLEPIKIGVVYGAAHMPAVAHGLADRHRYRPRSAQWMTVYAG